MSEVKNTDTSIEKEVKAEEVKVDVTENPKVLKFEVKAFNNRKYEFFLPVNAPLFESFEATVLLLNKIIETAKVSVKKLKDAEKKTAEKKVVEKVEEKVEEKK